MGKIGSFEEDIPAMYLREKPVAIFHLLLFHIHGLNGPKGAEP
jgi:hypothetical protein